MSKNTDGSIDTSYYNSKNEFNVQNSFFSTPCHLAGTLFTQNESRKVVDL